MLNYIKPIMIEPMSATGGLYLISKSPKYANTKTLTRSLKRPYYIKKKFSKFITKNNEILLDAFYDELIDIISDTKVINIIKFDTSIAVYLYVFILVLYIFIF